MAVIENIISQSSGDQRQGWVVDNPFFAAPFLLICEKRNLAFFSSQIKIDDLG